MKTQKSIKITAPKGKVINMDEFNASGEIVFVNEIPPVLPFPDNWAIFNDKGYFIDRMSYVCLADGVINSLAPEHRNVLPNRDLAEQMVIFTQLITLREEYRRIELHNNSFLTPIDWNDNSKPKYCLEIRNNSDICIEIFSSISHLFAFQMRSTTELFKNNFQNMILKCKDLLG